MIGIVMIVVADYVVMAANDSAAYSDFVNVVVGAVETAVVAGTVVVAVFAETVVAAAASAGEEDRLVEEPV